jgi:hypothetical protein
MKISEVIKNEEARTCQIQAEQSIYPTAIQTQRPQEKNAPARSSLVDETVAAPKQRKLSTKPTPMQVKRELMRRRLTRQLIQKSNIVTPTPDDLRIAHDRAEVALKRADLGYERKTAEMQRRR